MIRLNCGAEATLDKSYSIDMYTEPVGMTQHSHTVRYTLTIDD